MKSTPAGVALAAAGLFGAGLIAGCPKPAVQPVNPQPGPVVQGGGGSTLSSEAQQRAMLATVKVWIFDRNDRFMGSGSGTVISNDGLIITNWHCVGDMNTGQVYNPMGYLVVGPTKDFRQSAVPSFIAQVRSGDPKNDIAILQIVGLYNGQQLQPAPLPAGGLSLTPVAIGDANKVNLGEYMAVIGYPGVGGDTVTLTDGKVAGVADMDGNGQPDAFKTDALVNHGNSGGLAVNARGEQVGVPSNKRTGQDNDILFLVRMVSLAAAPLQQAMTSPMQFPQGGQQPAPPQPTPPGPTPQPTPQPQPAQGGLVIQGKVVDADTQQAIPGALFLILKPGVTVEQFAQAATKDARLALLAAAGSTDQSGAFQTTALPGGQKYTAIAMAQGYRARAFVNALDLPATGTVVSISQPIALQRAQ